MAIDAYGGTTTVSGLASTGTNLTDAPLGTNPDGILGKDDFMKLLLVELQYQDPTEPMDSEKILTQTSQLATLEATDKTNNALEELAKSLGTSQQYSILGAIGKTADIGSNGVLYEDQPIKFEMYFPTDVKSGNVTIMDSNGNTIKDIALEENAKGVYTFDWDGTDNAGAKVDAGAYYIESNYKDQADEDKYTRMGAYPIESVRFDNGTATVKLGSNYVPIDSIKEIY
ncbi:MAG: flagellar hook capping protein [Helicobacteraceae bacterium]|nr:flagellar hook capping protein [Helicobacteraceae bacterium]